MKIGDRVKGIYTGMEGTLASKPFPGLNSNGDYVQVVFDREPGLRQTVSVGAVESLLPGGMTLLQAVDAEAQRQLDDVPIAFRNLVAAESSPKETRITDPVTGGEKGSKQAQLGAVDPAALMAVAAVAGFGGDKYERYNFAKGYAWSLSYDALQRHLHAFWGGQDLDDESGMPHLAHAAWHCLALITFTQRNLGTDNRFPS